MHGLRVSSERQAQPGNSPVGWRLRVFLLHRRGSWDLERFSDWSQLRRKEAETDFKLSFLTQASNRQLPLTSLPVLMEMRKIYVWNLFIFQRNFFKYAIIKYRFIHDIKTWLKYQRVIKLYTMKMIAITELNNNVRWLIPFMILFNTPCIE